MPLQCNVTCTDTGLSFTTAHCVISRVSSYQPGGKSEALLHIYKDNTTAQPVLSPITFRFDTDMDSGTDGEGVNPFKAAEAALVNDEAVISNPNYADTFVGATIV